MLKPLTRLILVLLAAVALAACSGAGSSPEATAKAFIQKMYDGDGDGALKLAHMPQGKPGEAEMAQGKIRAGAAEAKAKAEQQGGLKEVEVKESTINPNDPNNALTVLRVSFKNGVKEERVRTIKVDGDWKVRLF